MKIEMAHLSRFTFHVARFVCCVSVFFTFHLSPFSSVSAQQPWNYSTLEEAHLDDAYFVTPSAQVKALFQKEVSPNIWHSAFNRLYRLSVEQRSQKYFLRFQSDSLDFTLPEELATELFPYLVSCRYWKQRYRILQQWAFVFMDKDAGLLINLDTADHRYGPYSPITWLGYRFQPSTEWPVVFTVRTNTHSLQDLTLPTLQRLAEWGSFATDDGQHAYELRRDSILRSQLAEQQALQHLIDSLDRTAHIFAEQSDSLTLALRNDSLFQVRLQEQLKVQAAKDRMNREQIFLMSLNLARSNYMFGLEFNFYNCFKKTISKIEITVIPVDAKGHLQPDRFNRDERTIRCMGPILAGSPAQYTFDELFWDDSGRIKYMRVIELTFHFTDGSHKNYNGYDKILKHTLNP